MRRFIIVLLLGILSLAALAQRQSIDVLNAQRRAAETQIARIDAQLRKIEGSKKDASEQLRLVKERLSKRRDVLRSIDAQISILDSRAREQSALATSHAANLDSMKTAYQRMISSLYDRSLRVVNAGILMPSAARADYIYKRHASSILLSVIESRSTKIRSIQGELGFELREIALRKEQLALLKDDAAKAVDEINREKVKIERLSASIDTDVKTLTSEKLRRLKSIDALQKQIEDAIRREVESSRKATSKGDKPTVDEKDPLSRAFAAAKGRMLSPVSPSKIVDTYGIHDHPTERGVKVDNKGVNLSGAGGATVRSVAKGEIRKIFVVAGMGTSVLVRHGAYLTVYSNLEATNVAVGNPIDEGAVIGRVAADGILHFEIWRETQTLNPMSWVKL